jgi:Bacterial RNA polymerase, alpha chain C terminal domain
MTQISEIDWPTLAEIDAWPVAEAGVCNRAVHCLGEAGVRTIAELRGWRRAQLMELPHFGVKSYQNIQWFFRWTRRVEKQDVPVLSLPELLREFLNKQEIYVLEQRFGLTDPLFRPHLKWQTLQDIADASGGLTRERVR